MMKKFLTNFLLSEIQHEVTVHPDLPLAVVEEILLNVPAQQVVCVCSLVCKEWKLVVDSTAFWKKRCRREFKVQCTTRKPSDWRTFYFISKKRHNLLKNPSAQERFNSWEIIANGGDHWNIENTFSPHPNGVTKCFVSSYTMCLKRQLINLEKEGYSASFMDEIQPDIAVSDWFAPRWDCGSIYEICVELLDRRKKMIKSFQPERVTFPQWNEQNWEHMTHTFKDYGPGVRFIRFTHGGQDTQFWAGHYGVRITDSSVEIVPAYEA